MVENKTQPTNASVEDFIDKIKNSRRKADALATLNIYKKITQLPAVMWGPSIIGFGTHHYQYNSGRKGIMPAAGFSPRKANLTLCW